MQTFLNILGSMPGAVAQGLIWGVMAIGVYITYKILDIADLTVDGSLCTGGAVCAMLIVNGFSIPVAMTAAFAAGLLTGLMTAIYHTALGIPAILSGILTQLSLYSINLKIMGKANQVVSARNYNLLLSLQNLKNVPFYKNAIFISAIAVIIIIVVLYWFFGTSFGCSIRATGSNLNMSRAQGINTKFTTTVGLMLSNGIVALAGAMLAQYQGFAEVQMGRGAIVIGLAAVIIGNAVFGKIFRNFALALLSVALGGVIYYIVYQTVIGLGLDPDLLKLLSAQVVAIFLALPYLKKEYLSKIIRKFSKGGKVNA